MKFKDFLKEWRIKNGMTQKEAAKKLFITTPTYVWWENGNHLPKLKQYNVIANITDTSIREIGEMILEQTKTTKERK